MLSAIITFQKKRKMNQSWICQSKCYLQMKEFSVDKSKFADQTLLREKCQNTEFFWSVFSCIRKE